MQAAQAEEEEDVEVLQLLEGKALPAYSIPKKPPEVYRKQVEPMMKMRPSCMVFEATKWQALSQNRCDESRDEAENQLLAPPFARAVRKLPQDVGIPRCLSWESTPRSVQLQGICPQVRWRILPSQRESPKTLRCSQCSPSKVWFRMQQRLEDGPFNENAIDFAGDPSQAGPAGRAAEATAPAAPSAGQGCEARPGPAALGVSGEILHAGGRGRGGQWGVPGEGPRGVLEGICFQVQERGMQERVREEARESVLRKARCAECNS